MRHHLLRCVIGVVVFALAGLPVIVLATPAISRADGECAPGWTWASRTALDDPPTCGNLTLGLAN